MYSIYSFRVSVTDNDLNAEDAKRAARVYKDLAKVGRASPTMKSVDPQGTTV